MPFGLAEFDWSTVDIPYTIWMGVGGAILVLLTSILSEQRRSAGKLFAGMIVGGSVAGVVGHTFMDHAFVYLYVIASAVMAENLLIGLTNASNQFSAQPLNVFAQLWRIIAPGFGKVTDRQGLDLPDIVDRRNVDGGGPGPQQPGDIPDQQDHGDWGGGYGGQEWAVPTDDDDPSAKG